MKRGLRNQREREGEPRVRHFLRHVARLGSVPSTPLSPECQRSIPKHGSRGSPQRGGKKRKKLRTCAQGLREEEATVLNHKQPHKQVGTPERDSSLGAPGWPEQRPAPLTLAPTLAKVP